MTGLDYSQVKPEPHRCDRPQIRTWDETAEDVFATVREIPAGTRFTCPCGIVSVVVQVPEYVGIHMVTMPYKEWRVESRKQRRERLGLHWWQR